jgi:hypothetical protein
MERNNILADFSDILLYSGKTANAIRNLMRKQGFAVRLLVLTLAPISRLKERILQYHLQSLIQSGHHKLSRKKQISPQEKNEICYHQYQQINSKLFDKCSI